jgi:hypothetical protein
MISEERSDHAAAPIEPADGITPEELQLAARNHGMPLEALAADVTPVGLHYLLRATDAAGNVQPVEQPWNQHGLANNEVQRVPVVVSGEEAATTAT